MTKVFLTESHVWLSRSYFCIVDFVLNEPILDYSTFITVNEGGLMLT